MLEFRQEAIFQLRCDEEITLKKCLPWRGYNGHIHLGVRGEKDQDALVLVWVIG